MIKKLIIGLAFLVGISTNSQEKNINNYKYVIVPIKFDFVKVKDQYKTSSLTKFLLKKKGFNVFLSDEKLPDELAKNNCLALVASIKDKSSMFNTKTILEFKDCFNDVILQSEEGKSRNKDYLKGYQESIRNTFDTMSHVTYFYSEINENIKKEDIIAANISDEIVRNVKTIPKEVEVQDTKNGDSKIVKKDNNTLEILYAQPTSNGFQLVNNKPEVVFILLNTISKDQFIIENKNGILTKINNIWTAEYYLENKHVIQQYLIKF